MVSDLNDDRWSSYQAHGLGLPDPLLSPFREWNDLGGSEGERRACWRRKVALPQDEEELTAVRDSVRTGRPFGTSAWRETMASRLGVVLNPRPRGRPRKEGGAQEK